VPRAQPEFENNIIYLNWQAPGRVAEKYAPLTGTRHAGAAAPDYPFFNVSLKVATAAFSASRTA
jgi:hypothetical protein